MNVQVYVVLSLLVTVVAGQAGTNANSALTLKNSAAAAPNRTPGFYRIIADASGDINNGEPKRVIGPHLRADYNKIYLRFYIGWTAGQKIKSATLKLPTRDWQHDPAKSFEIYALNDGIPVDASMGWNEYTLCASNAPANVLTNAGFDPKLSWELGLMQAGDAPDNDNPDKRPLYTCTFESSNLVSAIANDTNGYLTLMITGHAGIGNSCFRSRQELGERQPILEITTDGSKRGLDMTKPLFVVATGPRQTISGYGSGSGGAHGVKRPGEYWNANGQNLGGLSDQPERMQKYFDVLFKDTGANSIRLWMGDLELKSWERGYFETGEIKAAQRAGVTRFFLCANPPQSMWGPKTLDSYGIEPLSEAGVKDYPELLAEFTARVKSKFGIELYMITIANEELRVTIRQWPLVVKNLRQALDARGLTKVKIGGVDWPSNDNYLLERVGSIQNDPAAWKLFDVLTFHSYGLSLTENVYQQFIQGQTGKEIWQTETSSGGAIPQSTAKDVAGHMLNDLNHGAATWIYHELGLAQRDHQSQLVGYDPNGPDDDWIVCMPKYHYFKQIATTFPVGTRMRRIWGSMVGDAWYPGWGTPKVLITAGQRPDGSWVFAMLNTAEDNAADPQRTASLAVEELANVPKVEGTLTRLAEGAFKSYDLTPGVKHDYLHTTTEPIQLVYGVATLTLGPNELVTIHTKPASGGKY